MKIKRGWALAKKMLQLRLHTINNKAIRKNSPDIRGGKSFATQKVTVQSYQQLHAQANWI